ncbi:MAG: response regulator [Betaproteobacteria bacterium]|nr:response regulator [Betaproteobacteria bacterium]
MNPNPHDPQDLDFSRHFASDTALPEPAHTPEQLKEIDDLGSIGANVLKDQGFYVRIVTARGGGTTLPANPSVLVVEDDPGTSAVIVKALGSYGYRTRTAKDRGGIVAALSAPPVPDLILLDVMLEDINGFDVLNRVRQHGSTRWVPVIMLTSLSEPADIAKGLALGADAYLSKPLLPSTLIDAVQAVLGG